MASPTKSPAKKPAVKKAPKTHPSFLEMAIEAIKANTDAKGASVPSIRNYITEKYKTVDPSSVRFRLKQALTKGLEKNVISKSKQSDDRPLMTSRFRINKQATEKKKPKAEDKEKKATKPKKEAKAKEGAAKKPPAPRKKAEGKTKKSPAKKKTPTNMAKKTPVKLTKPNLKTPKRPQSAKKIKKTRKPSEV
ncbi:uncharacterized protein LOC111121652 [Crassostrea virginica]